MQSVPDWLTRAGIRLAGLKRGENKTTCPRCSGTRKKKTDPCLSVKIEADGVVVNCWHCGWSDGFKRHDQDIPRRNGHDHLRMDEAPPAEPESDRAARGSLRPLDDNHIEWLTGRGIDIEVAVREGLRSATAFIRAAGRRMACIAYPYGDRASPDGWKVRNPHPKDFICFGTVQDFWRLDQVDWTKPIIIVEGEMDALALLTGGIDNVVSVPNGALAKLTKPDQAERKFNFITRAAEKLEQVPSVLIAGDQDEAGEVLREELARRIGKTKCKKVSWGAHKDANEALLKEGADFLKQQIAQADPWPINGLYEATEFQQKFLDLYENGMGRGESTGYPEIDNFYTVVPGQLTVVTGIPGSGKSEWLDQLMVNLGRAKDWKFALCSFENEPHIHIANLTQKFARRPFFGTKLVQRMSIDMRDRAFAWVKEHFYFLHQRDGEPSTIKSILERARAAVLRFGIKGLLIDPYNYILRENREESETNWISDMLTSIRLWAQANEVHVWFVAHPTKMRVRDDGAMPVPTGYDISGSGNWFAKTDVGLTIHRYGRTDNVVEFYVWKCRFVWVGKEGSGELLFDTTTRQYLDMPDANPFVIKEEGDRETLVVH